jgi:hypothetical protein
MIKTIEEAFELFESLTHTEDQLETCERAYEDFQNIACLLEAIYYEGGLRGELMDRLQLIFKK